MTTRYQVTIAQTARECAALGGVMTMKVGVQGRVLLGPAGGPGQVDIPLRMAVVQEGPQPKTVGEQVLPARSRGSARADRTCRSSMSSRI